MDLYLKASPDVLMDLTKRMKYASEDLQKDATEIQYLLSQFGDALSGEDVTRTIDGANSEIDHCKQLCDTLNGISSDLRKIYEAYLHTEQLTVARINQSLRNNAT